MSSPKRSVRRAREEFERGRRAIVLEVDSIALNILVWGPDPTSGTPEAEKRRALKDALRGAKHNAMFSEDVPSSGLPAHMEEYVQANMADAIVVLYSSFGSIGEVHDFASDPGIAHKMLIWAPKKAETGYGATGLLKNLSEVGPAQVRYYSDGDLRDCLVVKRTVEHMRQRRWIKWMKMKETHRRVS